MKRIVLMTVVLLATACKREESAVAPVAGEAGRGKQLINQYGCGACHIVPGIDGALGQVGPSLEHVAVRQVLAGKLPNNPENMTQYLLNPQLPNSQNVMPNLGIKPEEARDIAAYLYTLK